MWQDPVVMDTRSLRELYAAQFGHDADAIFDDILRRQATRGERLVTFTPRAPLTSKDNKVQGVQEFRHPIP
jgi:hypothetical protein